MVGTTKRSIETIPSAWLRRNVLQPCDGGRLPHAMYLATEVWPTSMPSLRSSPWTLGAPQSGLARLISRISRRISGATLALRACGRDFQRQKERNPARCQRHNCFRLYDRERVQNPRRDPIQADEDHT